MLDVQFGQASDFGKVRTNNEDAMGSFIPASRQQAAHGYLFAVADGVGGMDLGEVASATAVSVLTEEFAKAQAGAMLISLLPRLIQQANARFTIAPWRPNTAARRWPPPWWPARCATTRPSSRMWATRAATWCATASQADYPGPYLGQRAAKDGPDLRQRDGRIRLPPRADSLAGAGDVRLAGHHRPHLQPATCWCFAPTACTTR
jgi:hypothetical protein